MPDKGFRLWVLEELEKHGVRPVATSSAARIREFLNDLYLFEIRSLRLELVERERCEGRKLRREYSAAVLALRERYRLLSVAVEKWS